MRSACVRMIVALAVLGCAPAMASADWLITGYAGLSWGTATTFNDVAGAFEHKPEPSINFGVSVEPYRRGALGYAVDVGFFPGFFGHSNETDFEFPSSHLITVMANVTFGLPDDRRWLGVRPYAAGGVGLISAHVSDTLGTIELFDTTTTTFGFNAGGGFTVPLGGRFGLMGDVRYFRSLQSHDAEDPEDVVLDSVSFWRGVAGVTFRF